MEIQINLFLFIRDYNTAQDIITKKGQFTCKTLMFNIPLSYVFAYTIQRNKPCSKLLSGWITFWYQSFEDFSETVSS